MKRRALDCSFYLGSCLSLLFGPSGFERAAEAQVFEVPPERGIQLGQGINSVSVDPLGLCIANGPTTDPMGGQTVEVKAVRIESRDQLESFLKAEAEASLNGPFTVSGKFQFLRKTYELETALYFFVKVSVRNPTVNLTEHRWASEMPLEYWQQGPEHFFAACGDRFVHGVTSGGELIVELKVSYVTEKEKTLIVGHMESDFLVIKGLADLAAKLKKLHTETRFSYQLYRRGSVGPIEFDPDGRTPPTTAPSLRTPPRPILTPTASETPATIAGPPRTRLKPTRTGTGSATSVTTVRRRRIPPRWTRTATVSVTPASTRRRPFPATQTSTQPRASEGARRSTRT